MSTVEFRVRPVIRHVVTRHTSTENSGSLETLGEFGNEGYAEIVSQALKERAAPREYVVVESTLGAVQAAVYYAHDENDLAHVQCQAAAEHPGRTFRVYSRPRNGG
jgi:hypothetical protein